MRVEVVIRMAHLRREPGHRSAYAVPRPPGSTATTKPSEVVTCNCVRNPRGGHAESNPRPSEGGVRFYHVLRPLDQSVCSCVPPRCGLSLSLFCNYTTANVSCADWRSFVFIVVVPCLLRSLAVPGVWGFLRVTQRPTD